MFISTDTICYWCKHRLNDHGGWYVDRNKGRLVMCEPYDVHEEDLAELITRSQEVGLSVEVSDMSPHLPGSTTAIIFRPAYSNR
jgi:hypothetical protein